MAGIGKALTGIAHIVPIVNTAASVVDLAQAVSHILGPEDKSVKDAVDQIDAAVTAVQGVLSGEVSGMSALISAILPVVQATYHETEVGVEEADLGWRTVQKVLALLTQDPTGEYLRRYMGAGGADLLAADVGAGVVAVVADYGRQLLIQLLNWVDTPTVLVNAPGTEDPVTPKEDTDAWKYTPDSGGPPRDGRQDLLRIMSLLPVQWGAG